VLLNLQAIFLELSLRANEFYLVFLGASDIYSLIDCKALGNSEDIITYWLVLEFRLVFALF
jgi:hypothetical protein